MPRIMVFLLPGGLLVVPNQTYSHPSAHPYLRPFLLPPISLFLKPSKSLLEPLGSIKPLVLSKAKKHGTACACNCNQRAPCKCNERAAQRTVQMQPVRRGLRIASRRGPRIASCTTTAQRANATSPQRSAHIVISFATT